MSYNVYTKCIVYILCQAREPARAGSRAGFEPSRASSASSPNYRASPSRTEPGSARLVSSPTIFQHTIEVQIFDEIYAHLHQLGFEPPTSSLVYSPLHHTIQAPVTLWGILFLCINPEIDLQEWVTPSPAPRNLFLGGDCHHSPLKIFYYFIENFHLNL